MSYENGIFIVGMEYSLHRSSKNPNVGLDVNTLVFFEAKLQSIKSKIWSEPFPTPIIEDGIFRYFESALTSLSVPSSGYSLISEFFLAVFNRSCWNCFEITKFSLESSFSVSGLFSGLMYPYPLNTLAIEAGIQATKKSKQIINAIDVIKKERQRIIENLKSYQVFQVFDSKANFVLFDAKGADERIYIALIEQGISIRKLGKIGKHEGCLRVTVGSKEMNSKFLLAIRDLLRWP